MHFLDLDRDFTIVERRLPHWSQAGTVCFITWRTIDSIPRVVLADWQERRTAWLAKHGQANQRTSWREVLRSLSAEVQREYHKIFSKECQGHLDRCHGACVLRDASLAQIVSKSLLHFDGGRYEMFDFVVMPNHVHVLATFPSDESMLAQCESWKHYTAVQINKALGSKGKFWQADVFDHLVRTEDSFLGFRRYIRENPAKAGLKEAEFVLYSK